MRTEIVRAVACRLALEAPAGLESRLDLDEGCFAFLPGVSFDPAELRVEQFVETLVLIPLLDDLDRTAEQQELPSVS